MKTFAVNQRVAIDEDTGYPHAIVVAPPDPGSDKYLVELLGSGQRFRVPVGKLLHVDSSVPRTYSRTAVAVFLNGVELKEEA